VLDNEKLASKTTLLIDYGVQRNLLEMRGAGWEHYVASPNAERAWCLERLADMGEKTGHKASEIKEWRKRASAIKQAVQKELWDSTARWFRSIYPDGHQELTYTIQVYDAIRAGVCTPQMTEALLSHLRDGAFLFPYGVSSISAEDSVHYEVNDTDWSGGGAYIGDGPDIALLMYELKRPELGWDILQRHFWMGKHLPYYPQEHYVDRPAVPAHKRANECAGLTGAETILYGIAGLDHRLDGSLWAYPQPPKSGKITLKGYKVKNHSIDIVMENNFCQVVLDGKQLYSGQPKAIKIL
jgi:glycogen debranching enzyme